MEKKFLYFLKQMKGAGPILLALSGGPDSMCLFHLLLRSKHPFHVAHVNHKWRVESDEEAMSLKKQCCSLNIPFHEDTLSYEDKKGNLEDLCRMARQNFFRRICKENNLGGVVLGHHADDQAETVLKRLFEGATLSKLRGLAPKTTIDGLTIYRPLLEMHKNQILKWLEENNISYFIDPTNAEPKYLRARMRRELLPILSQNFGKEISPSLCRIGQSALELQEFLEEILRPYHLLTQEVESRIVLDFNQLAPSSLFLWKAVIRDFFERQKVTISSFIVESIILHLQKKSCHKHLRLGKGIASLHKGVLSWLKTSEININELNS